MMEAMAKEKHSMESEKQQREIRNLVAAGLEQMKKGKTKEFNSVCDRLEKRYTNESVAY